MRSAITIAVGILAAAAPRNSPPTVQVELFAPGGRVADGTEVTIRVTVADPDGDLVSARLEQGPPWMWMEPIRAAAGPVVREFTWYAADATGGFWRIVVAAHDDVAPDAIVRGGARLEVDGNEPGTRLFDHDGDGRLELMVRAPLDDVGGAPDAGQLCVFSPGVAPPLPPGSIDLSTPGAPPPPPPRRPPLVRDVWRSRRPQAGDEIRDYHCVDFTGDGVDEVLAWGGSSSTRVMVWRSGGGGRAAGSSSARPADLEFPLPRSDGKELRITVADVTGDGFDDLLLGDPNNDALASAAGRLFVVAGGPALGSTAAITATLELPHPVANDYFGSSIVTGDVTGDGVADLLVASPGADVGGVVDCGAVSLFAGGSGLVGTLTPTALLLGAGVKDGAFGNGGLFLADLDGDGLRDVVVGATDAANGGELRYWRGGSGLIGTPAATAVMVDARSKRSHSLGRSSGMNATGFADVTGDGVLDVVAPDERAGPTSDGLIKVFAGGAGLIGTVAPTASLGETLFGLGGSLVSTAQSLRVRDLDGDGVADVFATAPHHKVGGVLRAGAAYLWKGGAGMAGTPAPTATLTVPGARTDDRLSYHGKSHAAATQVADVTGDGLADLVMPTPFADEGGVVDSGAIYVFAGGATLSGAVAPLARLVRASPSPNDLLSTSLAQLMNRGCVLADLTGDGIRDVVSRAPQADQPGFWDAGEVMAWHGGNALVGSVTPHARIEGTESAAYLGDGETGFELADLDDDGVLDLVALEPGWGFGTSGSSEVGRAHEFRGGSAFSGTLAPTRTLEASGYYHLFDRAAPPWSWRGVPDLLFADLDGDGAIERIAPSYLSDSSGAVFVWSGDPLAYPDPAVLKPETWDPNADFGG